MTRRISTKIFEWIDEALEGLPGGEEVRWDAQFAFNPATAEAFIAAYFAIPGAVLGTEVQTTVQMTSLRTATSDAISASVREVVDRLHEARAEQLVPERA
jgi:hypothetical protein